MIDCADRSSAAASESRERPLSLQSHMGRYRP